MKTKLLGRTGVQVSQLCFGCMSFGGDADEAASAEMFKAVRDTGINFFDTADQYSQGKSEEILGRLARGSREDLVIATKCFNPTGPDLNAKGNSRRHLTRALEASLKRLQTDRVEILYLHMHDPRVPVDEAMRALEDMVRSGKVLYPAVSNWSAWQVQQALGVQEANGWARLQAIQPMYNLVKRQAEVEILPMAQANDVSVFPYSPAGAGLLSGKYLQKDSKGRLVANKMYTARYGEPWMHDVAEKYVAFCKQRGMHPVSAAVAWVAAHPGVTAPIIGARSVQQLQASLDSLKIEMSAALWNEMAALSRTPPPATDRLEEQKKS
ncbi:aldo/keto reductase [Betaproteobacteria bacterium SCGC AG-212-J23]|nr:aldo/keto reductase [Betaproteobacteria bacterium SCGC AG-212-J23]